MSTDEEIGFPTGNSDERELLLSWLDYLRGAVMRNLDGLDEDAARWTPDGRLMSLIGIVNHLTHVEWRWVDRRMNGLEAYRGEEEFQTGPELSVPEAIAGYRDRAVKTNATVREAPTLEGS